MKLTLKYIREWTAPAFALYIINVLSKEDQDLTNLLDSFVFIILPCINPDGSSIIQIQTNSKMVIIGFVGYEFSRTKEKFWRKTRRPNGVCIGTDGNRNYDVHWNEGV